MTRRQHRRPGQAYRRMHRARQRQRIKFEVQLLRQVVAALQDFDPQSLARPPE